MHQYRAEILHTNRVILRQLVLSLVRVDGGILILG